MTTDARAPFLDPSGPIEFRPDMPVWARMRSTDTRVFIARFDDDVWSLNPIVQKPTIGSVQALVHQGPARVQGSAQGPSLLHA